MTTKVLIPKTGMGITEGTVARWLKAEGDLVTAGEVIVEIETAKAMQEVSSPVTGVLKAILLAEGQTAEVTAEIALIEEQHG
jgi:pyruvate/2-oxoglutarate dehydrogenase complex dihydrolipoamide acyltransferase (E2) component